MDVDDLDAFFENGKLRESKVGYVSTMTLPPRAIHKSGSPATDAGELILYSAKTAGST